MIHDESPTPDGNTKYPLHAEVADPSFEDRYCSVSLDSHSGLRNTRRDGIGARADLIDHPFACRVRQWKFGENDAPRIRFFMIAGIGHSCHFFGPLVKCMSIDDAFVGHRVEVYALDLPGHGASQSPPNIKFGMLRLEDYVDVIRQVMDLLKKDMPADEQGKAFEYVVAHSMGGMLAMLLEKSLVSEIVPTTLKKEYGTEGIILFAPAPPEKVDWSLGEGKLFEKGVPVNVLTMLLPYVTFSPRYLLHGRLSNEDFVNQFFGVVDEGRKRDRITPVTPVPGAPVGDMVSVMNSAESYIALSQLAGLDLESGGVLKRPDIEEGIFSTYKLGVSGYTHDILFRPEEEEALFIYLASGRRRTYKTVEHDFAVHDDAYSFPCASFRLLADVVFSET
jgi:Alpha/beta hydrolase family